MVCRLHLFEGMEGKKMTKPDLAKLRGWVEKELAATHEQDFVSLQDTLERVLKVLKATLKD